MLTIANANALHIPLPDKSVQCVVTSPPYWGLRDYGTAKWEGGDPVCEHSPADTPTRRGLASSTLGGGKETTGHQQEGFSATCPRCGAHRIDAQIGLEATPAEYVAHIVAVMRECWRVLKDDGVLWLNLGDSYASQGGERTYGSYDGKTGRGDAVGKRINGDGLKPKDLVGIPWRVAFALQDAGWYLRQDIIWHKPNPMPESVTDRCTKAHEYVFMLSKSARYYYDASAISEPAIMKPQNRYTNGRGPHDEGYNDHRKAPGMTNPETRNRRSVWTVATSPYSGSHFAVFPPALIEPMILAGTSARGECPHCGKAWARVVEVERSNQSGWAKAGNPGGNGKYGKKAQGSGVTSDIRMGPTVSSTTLGWRPQCDCRDMAICTADHSHDCLLCNNTGLVPMIPDPVPQTVLDPFAGSGTTGRVAVQHRRRAVLLDLNLKYIDLQFDRTNGVQITMQV